MKQTKHGRLAMVAGAGIAAMSLLVLTACSTDSSNETSTGDDGPVVLSVAAWKGGESEPANMEQINDLFTERYPDIKLEFEFVPPNDAYVQALSPQFLAGDAPDVVMTDAPKMADWAGSGYLEPLEDPWVDDILPGLRAFTELDEVTYGFPMEQIGIGLLANMDILAEAGITEVPTNVAELDAALAALEEASLPGLALPNKNGWTGRMLLSAIAASHVYPGTEGLDEDILSGDVTLNGTWNDSLDAIMELQDKGHVDWSAELGVDEHSQGRPDFIAGQSAFWFQGAWTLQSIIDEGVNVQFAPWPGATDGTSYGLLFPGTMWSINAASDVKDAARTYLEFWNDPEVLALFLEAENAFTTFEGGVSPDNDVLTEFTRAVETGDVSYTPVSTWMVGDALTAVNTNVQSRMLGELTTPEALTAIDEAIARLR